MISGVAYWTVVELRSSIPSGLAQALAKHFRNAFQKQAITPPITISATPDAIATQKSAIGDEESDDVSRSLLGDESGVPTGSKKGGTVGRARSRLTTYIVSLVACSMPQRSGCPAVTEEMQSLQRCSTRQPNCSGSAVAKRHRRFIVVEVSTKDLTGL